MDTSQRSDNLFKFVLNFTKSVNDNTNTSTHVLNASIRASFNTTQWLIDANSENQLTAFINSKHSLCPIVSRIVKNVRNS